MAKKKQIEYTVQGKLYFDMDEDVPIVEYLDKFREIGTAEVVDIKIVEVDR